MVEPSDKPTDQQTTEVADKPSHEQVKKEYKDNGPLEYVKRDPKPAKKEVWEFGCGGRVRIAKLFENHEPYILKIITIGGWVKTARASGKEFVFVELNDGSHF